MTDPHGRLLIGSNFWKIGASGNPYLRIGTIPVPVDPDDGYVFNFFGSDIGGVGAVGFIVKARLTIITDATGTAPTVSGTNLAFTELADSGQFVVYSFPSAVWNWWKIWKYVVTGPSPSFGGAGTTLIRKRFDATIGGGISVDGTIDIDADILKSGGGGGHTATRFVDAGGGGTGPHVAHYAGGQEWDNLSSPVVSSNFFGTTHSSLGPFSSIATADDQANASVTKTRALAMWHVSAVITAPP